MNPKRVNQEEILAAFPEHKNGKLELSDGIITHWKNRQLHNEDGPAVIYPNGYGCEYYRKGLLFRESDSPMEPLPAVKLDSRLEYWWWGKLHNIIGPAIHDPDRNIQVFAQHGKKHRIGSGGESIPAVIHEPEGYIGYWVMGERNRLDGPARVWVLENRSEWWIKGHKLTDEEMEKVKQCFAKDNYWPLLWGHPVLRAVAEFVKAGGTLSKESDYMTKHIFEKHSQEAQ